MFYRHALVAGALLLAASPAIAAPPRTVSLRALHGSGEHGKATLTEHGKDLIVKIAVVGMQPESPPEFAHIHNGSCTALGKPTQYELEPIRNGHSTTVLKNVGLSAFSSGTYSIVIHQTLAHISMHIACGTMPGG